MAPSQWPAPQWPGSARTRRPDRHWPILRALHGDAIAGRSRSNNIELVGPQLQRVVKDRTTGKPLTLLDDINLVIRPREFVCVLGPSGSGESTLLAMLSGRNVDYRPRGRARLLVPLLLCLIAVLTLGGVLVAINVSGGLKPVAASVLASEFSVFNRPASPSDALPSNWPVVETLGWRGERPAATRLLASNPGFGIDKV